MCMQPFSKLLLLFILQTSFLISSVLFFRPLVLLTNWLTEEAGVFFGERATSGWCCKAADESAGLQDGVFTEVQLEVERLLDERGDHVPGPALSP